MLLSYKWLQSFFYDSGLSNKTPKGVADLLTSKGIEVGSVGLFVHHFTGVVVGEVIECYKHPEADKLSLCKVSDGAEHFQVICGAANVRVGIKVAFAKVGAVLPGDFKIKKAKIRGVESFGMICSEKELGLSDESEGIWVLPNELELGLDICDFIELNDDILEIEITPNRGDCLSVLGLAREVAAGFELEFKLPEIKFAKVEDKTSTLTVMIENKDLCPSYKVVIIDNFDCGATTPIWMKSRLLKAGLRPISPVVDITNYVMLEVGHPMHAFDLGKLEGAKLVIRNASIGEKIIALDGDQYDLTPDDLIIADAKRPVAIAGVMGGLASSVTAETKSIVFESAIFDSRSVRKTVKRLGLSSESSYRFERGVSHEISQLAINTAVFLLQKIAQNSRIVQQENIAAKHFKESKIDLRVSQAARIIGKIYSPDDIYRLLSRLCFQLSPKTEDVFEVIVPSYRNDICLEIDLIEELARLDGYDNIANKPIFISPCFDKDANDKWNAIHEVKHFFKSINFYEAVNYSFVSKKKVSSDYLSMDKQSEEHQFFKVINPISAEEEYLNTSRLPRLLDNAVTSLNRGEESIKLFEFGKSFYKVTSDSEKLEENERYKLALVISGSQDDLYWQDEAKKVDFYYLKGVIEAFLVHYGIKDYLITDNGILIDGKKVGVIKRLEKAKTELFVCEFEADFCFAGKRIDKYQKLSMFPTITHDLSLITKKDLNYAEIKRIISQVGGKLLKNIKIFDVYQGKPFAPDSRNISVRLYFQSDKKTLEAKTVNFLQKKILMELDKNLGVTLRP